MQQYIGFTLDETEFAVPIVKVREIIAMPPVTRMPQAPQHIEGITSLRGAVIPVVNLGSLLTGKRSDHGGAKVIVLASGRAAFGVIVDGITGVVRIGEGNIEAPHRYLNGSAGWAEGVARVDDRLIVVLDTKGLFPSADLGLPEEVVKTGESCEGDTVEVVRTVQSAGGEVQLQEVRKVKDFLETRGIDAKDPRYLLFDDILRFMEALGDGDAGRADRAMQAILQKGQGDLFREVGKVARKLHDSVRNFNEAIDPTLRGLVAGEMPKAVDRLQFVIEKTEEAANKTMGIVEDHILRMDDLAASLRRLSGPEDAVAYLKNYRNRLEDDLTEIITTQSFQDLTGQSIRRVIELVAQIESELVSLVTAFGMKVEHPPAGVEEAAERVSQSGVDDLLREFGF